MIRPEGAVLYVWGVTVRVVWLAVFVVSVALGAAGLVLVVFGLLLLAARSVVPA